MAGAAMRLFCTHCSQVIDPDSLCPHRSPVCWACCSDAHPWQPQHDDPEEAA